MPLVINGETVASELIDAEFGQIKAHIEQQGNVSCCERDDEFLGYAKDNVTARILLAQHAREELPRPAEEDIDATIARVKEEHGGEQQFYMNLGITPDQEDSIRDDVAASIQMDRLVEQVSGPREPPTDEEVRAHYEEHIEDFQTAEEVRASHIFKSLQKVEDRETLFNELRALRTRAQNGEDFEQLARKHSDKPEDEIDLGFYKRGELMDEFELITFSMATNEVSPVFATHWGMHLAKVTERKPPKPHPLEEVADLIRETIIEERRNTRLKAFIETLKQKATIEDAAEDEEE